MKPKDFHFYVMWKNYANGEIEPYDVMPSLYGSIFNTNNKISKKKFYTYDKDYNRKEITTKSDLRKFINSHFRYNYWSKCEWEFIAIDWPTCIDEGRPQKIDVYDQLSPNIDLITEIIWDQIKDKLKNTNDK